MTSILLSWITYSGKANCHGMNISKQPLWWGIKTSRISNNKPRPPGSTQQGIKLSSQQLARHWHQLPIAMWVKHLGSKPTSLSQVFSWLWTHPTSLLQPRERPWARKTELCYFQITHPQKLWADKSLLFSASNFKGNLLFGNIQLI